MFNGNVSAFVLDGVAGLCIRDVLHAGAGHIANRAMLDQRLTGRLRRKEACRCSRWPRKHCRRVALDWTVHRQQTVKPRPVDDLPRQVRHFEHRWGTPSKP